MTRFFALCSRARAGRLCATKRRLAGGQGAVDVLFAGGARVHHLHPAFSSHQLGLTPLPFLLGSGDLGHGLIQKLAHLFVSGDEDIGIGVADHFPHFLAILLDGLVEGDRRVDGGPGAHRLERLEGVLIVVVGEIVALVVHVEHLEPGFGPEEQADFAFPTAAHVVDVAHERAERGDAGAQADHEQIGALVIGNREGALERPGHGELVARRAVAEVVRGFAFVLLAAVIVDVEAALDAERQAGLVSGCLLAAGDGVEAEVILVAELVRPRHQQPDAVTHVIGEVFRVQLDDDVSDVLVRSLRGDAVVADDRRDERLADVQLCQRRHGNSSDSVSMGENPLRNYSEGPGRVHGLAAYPGPGLRCTPRAGLPRTNGRPRFL